MNSFSIWRTAGPTMYSTAASTSALREFAALEKNVVLAGQGNKFELWDKQKWEELLERSSGFSDGDLPPELEGFSL